MSWNVREGFRLASDASRPHPKICLRKCHWMCLWQGIAPGLLCTRCTTVRSSPLDWSLCNRHSRTCVLDKQILNPFRSPPPAVQDGERFSGYSQQRSQEGVLVVSCLRLSEIWQQRSSWVSECVIRRFTSAQCTLGSTMMQPYESIKTSFAFTCGVRAVSWLCGTY